MPTAAKLVAALVFAAVGWFGAEAFRTLMPPETRWGSFVPICSALGLLVGWRVVGARARRGWVAAAARGMSASAVLVAVALFLFSVRELVLRALARRYDGPMEAVVGVFGVMLEYGSLMADAGFVAVLAVGGVLGGLAAEAAGRRWR